MGTHLADPREIALRTAMYRSIGETDPALVGATNLTRPEDPVTDRQVSADLPTPDPAERSGQGTPRQPDSGFLQGP